MDFYPTLISDLFQLIFTYVNEGSNYKKITLVCKEWKKIIENIHPKAKNKMCNHLLTLLKFFPDQDWDYEALSSNPNMTWDFVSNNIDKLWDWYEISKNPRVTTWEIVYSII
jgi:hypothetical protein